MMKAPKSPKSPPRRAKWFVATDAASIGIEMAVSVAIGTFGGMWLEHNVTHWSPWTMLLGMAVGIAAAAKAVLRLVRRHQESLLRSEAEPGDAPANEDGEGQKPPD
jgi:F0F1-type ATP synthase assembly protein I